MLSLHCDPLKTGGEEFLFGIDGDDVCAKGADARLGPKVIFGIRPVSYS
jgi:hypothetical protein